ncbi:hypothetical protein ACFQV4_25550 [Streptomyces thermocarboxydus]
MRRTMAVRADWLKADLDSIARRSRGRSTRCSQTCVFCTSPFRAGAHSR